MSAIYKLLRNLEKGGFATSKVGLSEEHRARRVYSITEQGRDALAHHLSCILSETGVAAVAGGHCHLQPPTPSLRERFSPVWSCTVASWKANRGL
jgi:DNA-binding PadR family transcriptional regulator